MTCQAARFLLVLAIATALVLVFMDRTATLTALATVGIHGRTLLFLETASGTALATIMALALTRRPK